MGFFSFASNKATQQEFEVASQQIRDFYKPNPADYPRLAGLRKKRLEICEKFVRDTIKSGFKPTRNDLLRSFEDEMKIFKEILVNYEDHRKALIQEFESSAKLIESSTNLIKMEEDRDDEMDDEMIDLAEKMIEKSNASCERVRGEFATLYDVVI